MPTPQVTLIVAGRIPLADGGWGRGEVWIDGETISAVFEDENPPASLDVPRLDVGDAFVLPGAVDAHVHCLSHAGEGVRGATAAAAAGGVTTIVEMPFDAAGPINSAERLARKQDLVSDEAIVDVALLGTLAPGGGWREADTLASGGVVGFKVSLFDTDVHRFPRISDDELLDVMSAVADTGRTLCTHAENNEVVKALLRKEAAAPAGDPHAHSRSRPPVSETLGVLTALEVAADRAAALHLCHMSLPRSVSLVRWYQEQGVDVSLETCPHYLTYTQSDLALQHGRLKINPPLRSAQDRAGMWELVLGGQVEVISSDHAPWPLEHKTHERILENHSGVPGVETLVAVTLGGALSRDPDLTTFRRVVDAMTIAPARRFGLDHVKGSLEPGKDADVMVFEPSADALDEGRLHSNAGWSPYHGLRPGGRVTHTIARGRRVWDAAAGLSAVAGRGQVVSAAGAAGRVS